MYSFNYQKVKTVADAAKVLAKDGDAKLLAGGQSLIAAMTRHAEVASSAAVKKAIPALASLAGGIGDRMVRNMGTIGGSLANNDPAADYPAGVLGLRSEEHTSEL